ncbi:hypothetical protein KP509_38G039400 [Ceratopteris richardii]|nr:hypothetical protein KP509_38G039400 [Ceratopteris richardii]
MCRSWSGPASVVIKGMSSDHWKDQCAHQLVFNHRFFFDRNSSRVLIDCINYKESLPTVDLFDDKQNLFSTEALSILTEELDSENEDLESSSTASSSWHRLLSFRESENSILASWPKSSTAKSDDDDDDDDDDDGEQDEGGFHHSFSIMSSGKNSHKADDDDPVVDRSSSSPSIWYAKFSSDEEDIPTVERAKKLQLTVQPFIKLRKTIWKKVTSKFKRAKNSNHQLASTIWSPTLATYLYNQQEEERQRRSECESDLVKQAAKPGTSNRFPEMKYSANGDGFSEFGSNRLHINPDYYLPRSFKSHSMNSYHKYSDAESLACSSA